MTDLFLDPKVLNYQKDRYELILLTMRWARAMKSKGSPEPLPVLIEKALRDIVENKITKEEILANKIVVEAPVEEVSTGITVPLDGGADLKALADDDDDEKKPKKKAKKKDD